MYSGLNWLRGGFLDFLELRRWLVSHAALSLHPQRHSRSHLLVLHGLTLAGLLNYCTEAVGRDELGRPELWT